ncbi:unnamed protein product [Zymoseptoria tritici ST99CH_3D1]|nr:unnamed protein product [Zymoseptoria tritici ST99CH_3D1]
MSYPSRLNNRVALITGGSSGLGRAIALLFARSGARICIVDLYDRPRNATNPHTGKADDFNNRVEGGTSVVEEVENELGDGRAVFVRADITVAGEVDGAVGRCVEVFGRLDIMMNNAGISVESTHPTPLPLHLTSESDWDKTFAINTKAVFLCCKYALIQMLKQDPPPDSKERGWIVNTASIQGLVAYFNTPSYTASKGAITQLTKQLALDYAPYRIHVNSLCPGFLRTAMTQNLQNDPVKQAEIDGAHPLGGMGDPEDVARVALFLASEDVRWVTGVNLPVDGGYTAM